MRRRGEALVLALLLSIPLAAAAPLPQGCQADAGRLACAWTFDTTLSMSGRFEAPMPVLARALANVTIAVGEGNMGWRFDIVDHVTGNVIASGEDVGQATSARATVNLLLLADPTHGHDFVLYTDTFQTDRVAPGLPAYPGTHARFDIIYDAQPLPEGEVPSSPAATRADPHLQDQARDARRPDLDVLAAWFDDERVGDGMFGAHLAVANLSAAPAKAGPGVNEVIQYSLLFNLSGEGYRIDWSYAAGIPDSWSCRLLRIAGGSVTGDNVRVTDPSCDYDITNSTITAIIAESALGSPSPGATFTGMVAQSGTQEAGSGFVNEAQGGDGFNIEDTARGERFPFALGGPDVWARLRGEPTATTQASSVSPWTDARALWWIAPIGLVAFAVVVLPVARRRKDPVLEAVREEDTKYLRQRRLDLYRAALERQLDGRPALTEAGLAQIEGLRARLAIGDAEHEAALADVRARWSTPGTPSLTEPAKVGDLLLARYKVLAVLGEGGGGRAYRCEDTTLQRVVAVKEIEGGASPQRRQALREARAMARLHDPRVVTIHEIHEWDGGALLVMEYVGGGSLAQVLASGALSPERGASILTDVLQGLDALHKAGLLHRDIKPSNVLLDGEGRAKLADLGVARVSSDTTIHAGRRVGTPTYMAPENILGQEVDARADVYAAGALLYEMLAGEPYVRPAMREGALVEEAIVSIPPPLPIPGAPAWANELLRRALAKDPAKRPASAREAAALVGA